MLVVGFAFSLVATRPYDDALFHHARAGSDWSHHYIRVQMATSLQTTQTSDLSTWLVEGDHDFPPLIHVVGTLLGYVVGHSEANIQRTGLLWVLILGLAVGLVAARLSRSRPLGIAAGTAVLLMPSAHAASMTYYFDLPMTALLWLSAAVLMATQDKWPLRAGVLAGAICFLAGLGKWTALPMAPPLLLGVLACLPPGQRWTSIAVGRRVLSATALTGTLVVLLVHYWKLSTRSWDRMLHMTYGGDLAQSAAPDGNDGDASGILSQLASKLPDVVDLLAHINLDSLFFYPVRLVFCVLSPMIAVLVIAGGVLWLRRSTLGWPLVGCLTAGHLFLLYFVIPDLDDRFLLTLAPALVLAAVFGWQTLSEPLRSVLGCLFVCISLWVAWDFHHTPPEPPPDPGPGEPHAHTRSALEKAIDAADVLTNLKGPGLQSGVDRQWGWSRADDVADRYFPLRDIIWEGLVQCEAQVVLVENLLMPLDVGGLWWSYRNALAALEGEHTFQSIQGFEDTMFSTYSGDTIQLEAAIESDSVVVVARNDLSHPDAPLKRPPLLETGWRRRALADRGETEGASHLAIWAPVGSKLCSQWAGQPGELGPPR
ncbi:MAG TPA: hypothetical protein DIU15_07195 [Deltaproteobacteria bacterium]|mgnify:CR=1 FL=1|nr:hypothetical protein [Deltaproteobacteria bacterium]HCP45809.1 hypothetical protein [Deltaproteobacteria bacterium]